MAKIGTFTATETGFSGTLNLLTKSIALEIVPNQNKNSKDAPEYKIIDESGYEFGAGWTETARESGKPYVSARIDSPELPAPIYANLVKDDQENVHHLYWDRPKTKKGGAKPTHSELTGAQS